MIYNRTSSDPIGKHYFPIVSDEVLLKIILESMIHINALNKMEINLLS